MMILVWAALYILILGGLIAIANTCLPAKPWRTWAEIALVALVIYVFVHQNIPAARLFH